jgi:hypothetical protein
MAVTPPVPERPACRISRPANDLWYELWQVVTNHPTLKAGF